MADEMKRRTKRRYAYELHPGPSEFEVRPLEVDVPYLYARAAGLDVEGTGWFTLRGKAAGDRIGTLVAARQAAFTADAFLQGMTGQSAWQWAQERTNEESGDWVYERAEHYGVPIDQIKPYPCGDDPDNHEHYGDPDKHGLQSVHRIPGTEADCLDCTEPIEQTTPKESN